MQVVVHYLFSKNKKIGSKLIRFITKSLGNKSFYNTPSHTALLLNNKWVIESTIEKGLKIDSYSNWKKRNTELSKILSKEKWYFGKIKTLYRSIDGEKYDYLGVLYFAWRIILKLSLRIEFPKINKWHNPDRYFCTEVIGRMTGEDYQMTSPVELMEKLLNN